MVRQSPPHETRSPVAVALAFVEEVKCACTLGHFKILAISETQGFTGWFLREVKKTIVSFVRL